MKIGEIPIYARIGSGEECQIGTVELDSVLGANVAAKGVAALLRTAADGLEAEAAT